MKRALGVSLARSLELATEEKRLGILNHRLDVMKGMYEMVQSELNIKDYTRLEMTVVLLIVVEVVINIAIIVVPLWA